MHIEGVDIANVKKRTQQLAHTSPQVLLHTCLLWLEFDKTTRIIQNKITFNAMRHMRKTQVDRTIINMQMLHEFI